MPTRKEMWERLDGHFDLLIIGGGINGAGIARDAARRGLSVAVVEMNDLASGTSSRSSKLVHGGLRYLESLEFSLVFESVSERRILLDIAPHLVNPLGFIFPVYKGHRHNLWAINAGMWLYAGLSLFRSPKRHKKLNKREVSELEPALNTENLKGAPLYYDCGTDDARLTLETALDAIRSGAVVSTWTRAIDLVAEESGRAIGLRVKDELSGEEKVIHGHTIVNATGPWTDDIIKMAKGPNVSPLIRPTKGVHLVVERDKLPVNNAVVCFHPTDGRVLFAIPWGDRTYLGTTDTDFSGDPAKVYAEQADIDYLINAANAYFPAHPLSYDDVISTWAGLRPLIAPKGAEDEVSASAVSREHQIVIGHNGMITIAGGKLTTYRRMSVEVVDTVLRMLRLIGHLPKNLLEAKTGEEPLLGAVGWPEDDDHDRVGAQISEVAAGRLSPASCRHLADSYGMRGIDVARMVRDDEALGKPLIDGRHEIMAQVHWAVEVELAGSLADVLMRRTQLFFKDLNQGLGAVEVVADTMQKLVGWTDEQKAENVSAYRAEVEASRAWRTTRSN